MKDLFSQILEDIRFLWVPAVIAVFFAGFFLSVLGLVCFTVFSIFKLFAQ